MALPPVPTVKYNKWNLGYFGELGNGAHARIRFLQSAVTKDQLDDITLIENISGSEQWDVRDLFQRDVDMVRVEQSIIPYLKDASKVKFFNPLTLVLLPFKSESTAVDSDIPFVEPVKFVEDGHSFIRYEREGLFVFEVHSEVPAYSKVKWNDRTVKLVAIDGQHRLSALKFWKKGPGPKDLDAWQIPVVILGVFRADNDPSHKPATLLEIVRKTFVFINTRAESVNEARRILLDDEDLNAVCSQEFIQASHANDCMAEGERDDARTPLLFFDWRGQVKWRKDDEEGAPVAAPGSVLSIEEVNAWLEEYLFEDRVEEVLALKDLHPPLSETFRDHSTLTHEDTERVRKRFKEVVYPGLSSLIEKFAPFQKYIARIRDYEKKERAQSPEASLYAFQKLRFGSHPDLLGQMKDLVDERYDTVVKGLSTIRADCFDQLIERDIGKRAIVYAFAQLMKSRRLALKKTPTWQQHADWFVPKLNAIYLAGWFKRFEDMEKEKRKLLTHVCFEPGGDIVNYKLGDVAKGLGPFVALLAISEGLDEFTPEQRVDLWDEYTKDLGPTLRKGFRREHKARLKETFTGTPMEFVAAVNKRADKSVEDRLAVIETRVMGA